MDRRLGGTNQQIIAEQPEWPFCQVTGIY